MRFLAFSLFWLWLASPAWGAELRVSLMLEHEQPAPWTNMLRQGLERAGGDFGVQTRVVIAPREEDQTAIFRRTAAESDLVLVASDNLHEILRDNASNFRRVMFGSVDAGIRGANIMSVTFADEQAAFLAGAVAAMLTTSPAKKSTGPAKIAGWLAGADTPAMRTLIHGFEEGLKLADPGARLATAVVGSFTDAAGAANKAAWLAGQGAAVMALAAGTGNPEALAQVRRAGGFYIAVDSLTPGAVCAITKAADRAVYEIVASAATGRFRAKEIVVYDLANGGVALEGLEAFLASSRAANRQDIARRARELRRELENGSVRIRSLRARTLCDCLD